MPLFFSHSEIAEVRCVKMSRNQASTQQQCGEQQEMSLGNAMIRDQVMVQLKQGEIIVWWGESKPSQSGARKRH